MVREEIIGKYFSQKVNIQNFICVVRNALIVFAMFSMLGGFVITVTSTIIIMALRKVS